MQFTEPKKLILKGTPAEIGLQHGHSLQSQIKSQIAIYAKMFLYTSALHWDAVKSIGGEFRPTIENLTPAIYEEMLGIARGAGVDILDILALNCRSEIALGRFSDGCTSLSWKKSDDYSNDSSGRLLSQNWDWVGDVKENLAMVSIEQPDKPGIYMVTEAGIIGKIGFNTAGVGTCLNAIRARPTISTKLPIHVALRLCLESTSVENAVRTLSSLGGVASSQHILIADPTISLGLELSPLGDVHLKEDELLGIITHTNHFTQNRFVDEPPWLSGSPVRLERIRQLLRELIIGDGEKIDNANSGSASSSTTSITPALLREKVFSDTFNEPQSICCYEDRSRDQAVRSKTLFNIVMNLDSRGSRAEVIWGQPGFGEEGRTVFRMPWC